MTLQEEWIKYGHEIEEGCQQDDDEQADECANLSFVNASKVADELDTLLLEIERLKVQKASLKLYYLVANIVKLQKTLRREK